MKRVTLFVDRIDESEIRHALGVAEQVMLPADDACRCTETAPATLAQSAEWEQADDCPVHPRAAVAPVTPPCAGPEHGPGCDCCSCELDLISIDATAEPMAHIHDPFPVADGAGRTLDARRAGAQ